MAKKRGIQRQPTRRPAWRIASAADAPPCDNHRAWMRVKWPHVREALRDGQAVVFNAEASGQLAFIRYAVSRLGIPVRTQCRIHKGQVWIYPAPWRRRVSLHGRSQDRPVLTDAFRSRLRFHAALCIAAADAGEFVQGLPVDVDWRSALAMFVEESGDDYGFELAANNLARCIGELEGSGLLIHCDEERTGDDALSALGDTFAALAGPEADAAAAVSETAVFE